MAEFIDNLVEGASGFISQVKSTASDVQAFASDAVDGASDAIDSAGNYIKKQFGDSVSKGTPEAVVSNVAAANPSKTESAQIEEDQEGDPRIRLQARVGQRTLLYGPTDTDHLLRPIQNTNGVIFPYTPTITNNFSAEYATYAPTHSIQDFYSYNRTPAAQFTISGMFSAQNYREARYCLAVIHFFRTITKMVFGVSSEGQPAGLTPPVLLLNGYGSFMFNNLPVIVTNYSIEMPNNVDYVKVRTYGSINNADPTGNKRLLQQTTIDAAKSNLEASSLIVQSGGELDEAGNAESIKTLEDAQRKLDALEAKKNYKVGTAWVPSAFLLTCTVVMQHTPKDTTTFDMAKFRTGELLKSRAGNDRGGWW
jgi:hypothetical protein